MGTEFFKQPAKALDRQFRMMGARRVNKTPAGVFYLFPDGAQHMVQQNIGAGSARVLLGELQARYGARNNNPLGNVERRPGAPIVDLTRVVASTHAIERFRLMQQQATLEYSEILMALRAHEKVRWSLDHDSWIWVSDRIAVPASMDAYGNLIIRTILWTTPELWAKNPRPEKTP